MRNKRFQDIYISVCLSMNYLFTYYSFLTIGNSQWKAYTANSCKIMSYSHIFGRWIENVVSMVRTERFYEQ